ncbi:hypothetical protein F3I16_15980 [Pseudomonas sp. L-22-4S-12]|uniref:hypothetical protein n=1 Tax=Pseudomonas sp. L-22-4S-12 TaxID=2610893 RepID=UPI0013289925|nr:hypothetical protein [Pseudomonas sp. L-22-4S-12]MWV17541.1 hypothetical protein [Pseudomonas sp. L-22-4S-12]
MPPPFQINDDEWSLLAEEPAEVFKLYCVLRRAMNFATGVAGGEKRRFNEQGLREALYVAPIRGRHESGSPTRQKVRSLIDRLVVLGALQSIGPLVFQLPLATRDSPAKGSATNQQPVQQPHQQPEQQPINNQTEPSNDGALAGVAGGSTTNSPAASPVPEILISNLPPVSGKSQSKSKSLLPPSGDGDGYTEEFERFWSAYPKRLGTNSKKAAFKCWKARLREGASVDDLIKAASCYATACNTAGKTGTEYVKQAATFLGPDEHWREALKLQGPGSGWPQANKKHGGFDDRNYTTGIGADGRF